MKYVLDVQYKRNENTIVVCIGFKDWEDEKVIYFERVLARGKEQQ